MDVRAAARDVLRNKGGIAKSADFVAAGICAVDIVNLCNVGYLDRVRHGYYQMAEQNDTTEEQLLAALIPQGVVCVESALFFYGYSSLKPARWSIAVPRSVSRAKLEVEKLPLHTYYVQQDIYELGKTTGRCNGIALAVYDRERTVCDCFKYRTRLDNELFSKALTAYANDPQKNLTNLSLYAKKLRVDKKVTALMEVLLNG